MIASGHVRKEVGSRVIFVDMDTLQAFDLDGNAIGIYNATDNVFHQGWTAEANPDDEDAVVFVDPKTKDCFANDFQRIGLYDAESNTIDYDA